MSEKTAAIGFISSRCESEAAGAQAAPTEPRHKEGSSTVRERGQGARASTAAATPPFGSGKWTSVPVSERARLLAKASDHQVCPTVL